MIRIFAAMTALSATSLAAGSEEKSVFTNGGRWLALGDSITESGHYVTWMEYFFRCRTGGRITSWNGGVGGDTSKGGLRRIDKEIALARPSLVSVMFGMNDVNRGAFTPEAGKEFLDAESARTRVRYATNLRALLDRMEAAGATALVLAPTPFDHADFLSAPDLPGVDEVLRALSDEAREIAAERGVAFVDIHAAMKRENARFQNLVPGETLIGADRVHPGAIGQLVVAITIASQTLPLGTREAEIEEFRREGEDWSFTVKLPALPVILPNKLGPESFLEELRDKLGRDILSIPQMKGRYVLLAEGKNCGSFSGEELAKGVDLSRLAQFPATVASASLWELLTRKMHLQWEYRQIAWCEFMASEKSPGVSDLENVVRILREMQVEKPWLRAPIERRLENYPRLKASEEDLLRRIEATEREIDALKFPGEIRCVLRQEN